MIPRAALPVARHLIPPVLVLANARPLRNRVHAGGSFSVRDAPRCAVIRELDFVSRGATASHGELHHRSGRGRGDLEVSELAGVRVPAINDTVSPPRGKATKTAKGPEHGHTNLVYSIEQLPLVPVQNSDLTLHEEPPFQYGAHAEQAAEPVYLRIEFLEQAAKRGGSTVSTGCKYRAHYFHWL